MEDNNLNLKTTKELRCLVEGKIRRQIKRIERERVRELNKEHDAEIARIKRFEAKAEALKERLKKLAKGANAQFGYDNRFSLGYGDTDISEVANRVMVAFQYENVKLAGMEAAIRSAISEWVQELSEEQLDDE